jgi:CDP-glycerol glycerophosphotransferase
VNVKIVYNSYHGRYSDSPRVLYKALLAERWGSEHLWLVDPRYAAMFPPGIPTVPVASAAAVAALEEADLLIANCHVDSVDWCKRPQLRYLQTWHGTPLKRIHRAAVGAHAEDGSMDGLDADIARWDYLITPSRAGTELLREAFGYTGAVLETGYPRNDVLNRPDHEERRARVRHGLGIAEDETVVLYAPTFRDDDVTDLDVPLSLDVSALAAHLGEGYRFLVRRHYFHGQRPPLPGDERIRDVSSYSNVSDLYLAADVLVSDYSSVIFDFAVTGKPILLFAYDLEHYRDRLRGFTMDLHVDMPGPVLHHQAELETALLDLAAVRAAFAERYAVFRDRYCHLDDGHATERVVNHLRKS